MSNLIVGLDLGTTKVCACAGRKTKEGQIEVIDNVMAEIYKVG